MSALARNNVTVRGVPDGPPLLFVHGFGCDQNMWRLVWPAFAATHRVVLMDHVGAGGSDVSAYDPSRYATLAGYASDVLDVCAELDLQDVTLVGHSVSAMIGALAAVRAPERFARLVMVCPSPRYVDDEGYVGGFSRADIEELLDSMDHNYLGWSSRLAPVIMGPDNGPELATELTESFCRADPEIARQFARTTFLSDNRSDLTLVSTPTLILQCANDAIAPEAVGAFVHEHVAGSELVHLQASGHCPNLSAPQQTIDAMRPFVGA